MAITCLFKGLCIIIICLSLLHLAVGVKQLHKSKNRRGCCLCKSKSSGTPFRQASTFTNRDIKSVTGSETENGDRITDDEVCGSCVRLIYRHRTSFCTTSAESNEKVRINNNWWAHLLS